MSNDKNRKQILLRINPDLFKELNRWAEDEMRSLNAQIEYILTKSLKKERHVDLYR